MKLIKIKHPTLDDGRVTEVPEQAMSHWAAVGWIRADESFPETVPAEAPPAPAAQAPEPPTRRGRTSKEVSD